MRLNGLTSRIPLVALLVFVFAALVLLVLKTGLGNYSLDDAYIVEHSVAGILSGQETRFIGSSPWEGVTSPFFVGLVALLSLLLPIQLSHWIVSTTSVLLLAAGWYLLCRRHKLSESLSIAVVLVSLLAGMTYHQFVNGLETGMAMAAITWTLLALDWDSPPEWGYALIALQCFIRPELAALSTIFGIYILAKRPAGWVKGLLITLGVFVLLALLLYVVSGTLVPNTVSAKVYFFAEGCAPDEIRSAVVSKALVTFCGSVGLFAIGFAMALLSRQRLFMFLFLGIFLFAYYQKLPGALFHNYSRYLYVFIPIAVFGWAAGLGHRHTVLRLGSAALGIVVAVSVIATLHTGFLFHVAASVNTSSDNRQMAQWVVKNVPKDAVIMIHDAGMISTMGEQPLVDLVGLKSYYSVLVHRQTTFAACTRVPRAVTDIARNAGATYIIVTAGWDSIFRITDSLRMYGWTVERADKERGESIYQVFKITDNGKATAKLRIYK